jgi:hypothetical protein
MDCPTTRKLVYVGLNMEWSQVEGLDSGNADQNISDRPNLRQTSPVRKPTSTFAPMAVVSRNFSA